LNNIIFLEKPADQKKAILHKEPESNPEEENLNCLKESFKIDKKNEELLNFPSVLEMILDSGFTLEDIFHDPSIVHSIKVDNDNDEKINEFIKTYKNIYKPDKNNINNNNDDGEITKFFKSLGVADIFKAILGELEINKILLSNLLKADVNAFKGMTSNLKDSQGMFNFYKILQVCAFMENNSFPEKYNNLIKLIINRDISLSKLIYVSQNEDLELFLLLQVINLQIEISSKDLEELQKEKHIDKFKEYINNNSINNFTTDQINTINNIIDFYNNCCLRKINFFNFNIEFHKSVLTSDITIKN